MLCRVYVLRRVVYVERVARIGKLAIFSCCVLLLLP